MKTTEAQVSTDKINLFKGIHNAGPDEVRGHESELRKVAGKKKAKRKGGGHAAVSAMLREQYGDKALTPDGATAGNAAFGTGSNHEADPPPNSATNAREVRAKRRLIASQNKKGFGAGPEADADAFRKIRQRGPSGRLA